MLLVGALIIAVAPLTHLVDTFDGSVPKVAQGAVWVILAPGLLALFLSMRRPRLALACTAGAGLLGLGRMVADLSVLTGADTAVRPELFYEGGFQAQPLGAADGSYLLLAGDLIMVVAGTLAARGLGSAMSRIMPERLDTMGFFRARTDETDVEDPGPIRNNRLILLGFVGVLILTGSALSVPYAGGFLAQRALAPSVGLLGVAGVFTTALIAAVAVLVAAALPRAPAVALLLGTALTCAIPSITALLVGVDGIGLSLRPGIWVGLAGSIVVATAGLSAAHGEPESGPEVPQDSELPGGRVSMIAGGLELLAAVACALAGRLPPLLIDGAREQPPSGGYAVTAPISLPFAVAAVGLAVTGILTLIPPTARAGRIVGTLFWAVPVYAVAGGLAIYSEVSYSVAATAGTLGPDGSVLDHRWSIGPGMWSGIVGMVLSVVAAVLAGVAARRVEDSVEEILDEVTADAARRRGALLAAILTAAVLVASSLPVYEVFGSGPSLLQGYQIESLGLWFVALVMIAAAWIAARTSSVAIALAACLAGAAVEGARLLVPVSTSAQVGYSRSPGFVAGIALAACFAVAGVFFVWSAGSVQAGPPLFEPAVPTGKSVDGPGGADKSSSGRAKNTAASGGSKKTSASSRPNSPRRAPSGPIGGKKGR